MASWEPGLHGKAEFWKKLMTKKDTWEKGVLKRKKVGGFQKGKCESLKKGIFRR